MSKRVGVREKETVRGIKREWERKRMVKAKERWSESERENERKGQGEGEGDVEKKRERERVLVSLGERDRKGRCQTTLFSKCQNL